MSVYEMKASVNIATLMMYMSTKDIILLLCEIGSILLFRLICIIDLKTS